MKAEMQNHYALVYAAKKLETPRETYQLYITVIS